ncbi:sigma-70 family RNA polymerase sigma factor [Nocardioidaceae bacterium]|nr:sigma-70 family RNA polymerase sigma factor [Nocardioidaceae bacterium]
MTQSSETRAAPVARPEVDLDADFEALVAPHRRELLAHCYRMVGSPAEAEDLVQETYLRAWRSRQRFEGRSSVRTWLYRIATNVCLTNIEGRDRRPLPTGLGAPSLPADAPLVAREIEWLGPLPDAMVAPVDPGEVAVTNDGVRLAFVAALQHLPARQRAVLVLRDVLRWSAAETAAALDTTVAAVNSALQRAHATLEKVGPDADTAPGPLTARQEQMLRAYVEAFWRKDVDALASLLTADAVWEMPPWEGWYAGPATIAGLVSGQCPGQTHDMPMLPTSCNGQPAFGLYMRESALVDAANVDPAAAGSGRQDVFVPFQLHVLDLDAGTAADERPLIDHVVAFFGPDLFAAAGLPSVLTAEQVATIVPLQA